MMPQVAWFRRCANVLLRGAIAWILLWTQTFILLRLLAPDPVTVATTFYADDATRQRLEREFGTSAPWWNAYFQSLYRAATLDFGVSRRSGVPVTRLLSTPLMISAAMTITATTVVVVGCCIAFTISAVSGFRVGRAFRIAASSIAGVPAFMLALIISISNLPRWIGLPHQGRDPVSSGWTAALILPTLSLVLPVLPYAVIRSITCYEQIASAEWYRTFRAFGGSKFATAFLQGWPMLSLTLMDVTMNTAILVLTGSVAVEFVFAIPGLGTAMLDAVQLRDAPVILALVALVGFLTILMSLAKDALQGWLLRAG
jgi:peptide/nickel transport system permease protein